jgi:hypothetical protein
MDRKLEKIRIYSESFPKKKRPIFFVPVRVTKFGVRRSDTTVTFEGFGADNYSTKTTRQASLNTRLVSVMSGDKKRLVVIAKAATLGEPQQRGCSKYLPSILSNGIGKPKPAA